MIYTTKPNTKENDFLSLLENAKGLIFRTQTGKKPPSPSDFEGIVFEQMCKASKGTDFHDTIAQTSAHEFPDIVANRYFGVEVKMTLSDHWTSTGNSVLESLRIEDVERIYIFFGKFGGQLDIRYRLYQECLPEVSVTHSPRYRINMDLQKGKSIFDKMGIDYDLLRKDENAIKKIKDYYRRQLKDGEELWWIDQEQDKDGKFASPIIRPFRGLNREEKESFMTEAMILFPEMFGNNTTKFERAAAYLIAEYNAVSANLRDTFTAGGKVKLKIKNRHVVIPRITYALYLRAKVIKKQIMLVNHEKLKFYWRNNNIQKDVLGQWKKLINNKFALTQSDVSASDIFEAGLL
jgi:hypothetical protein